jgi:hypothetical protein
MDALNRRRDNRNKREGGRSLGSGRGGRGRLINNTGMDTALSASRHYDMIPRSKSAQVKYRCVVYMQTQSRGV